MKTIMHEGDTRGKEDDYTLELKIIHLADVFLV